MKYTLARLTICLTLMTFTGAFLFAQSSATKTSDQIAKEQKKAAEEQKKAAENARKAEEKAVKEAKNAEEKAMRDAKKNKNQDLENIGNRNINKGTWNLSSLEKEIAEGRLVAAEIEREVKLINDPVITEYINRVGQNIAQHSDAKVPFQIKVVDSPDVNAFALPGGFFYVNSGLILEADEEAELAGVMAHEIAHVAARHGTENATKGTLTNFLTIPLIFLGGPLGMAARQLTQIAIPLKFLQFSKGAEKEADWLGLQYMDATGYDPSAAVSFFEKLQAKEQAKPGTISQMFATHPPTDERIRLEKANITLHLEPREQYVVTTSEFQKVKARLASLQSDIPDPQDSRPSLKRPTRRPNPDDDADSTVTTTTRPEDREPAPDDRPTIRRRD